MDMKKADQVFEAGVSAGVRMLKEAFGSGIANPEQWLLEALGGAGKTNAGVTVNYRSAMSIAYVFAAQQIISGDVARLPLEPKRIEDDNDEEADKRHYTYFLLNGDVNEEMSSYLFRETLTNWALILGNGLAYILRDSADRPTALIPACPGDITVQWNAGRRRYFAHVIGDTLSSRDVLHIRGLGDDMWGHPLIKLAKESFGLSIAQDKHGAESWKNGTQPKIVLTHPGRLTQEQADELLERFAARHSEANLPALAAGGLGIETLQTTNTDAQWNESRQQIITEIAAWYGIPPHKLGDNTRVGYNGVAAENQAYLSQTLQRWLKRWETECNRKLLAPREYRSMTVAIKHDVRQITDADTEQRTAEIVKLKEAEIITPNEARQRAGYKRVEGGDIRQNSNKATTAPASDTEADAADSVDRGPFVLLLSERLEHVATQMQDIAARKLKKNADLGDWNATWSERCTAAVQPAYTAISAAFKTQSMDVILATVNDWATATASGGIVTPSPSDLANQIIGEQL